MFINFCFWIVVKFDSEVILFELLTFNATSLSKRFWIAETKLNLILFDSIFFNSDDSKSRTSFVIVNKIEGEFERIKNDSWTKNWQKIRLSKKTIFEISEILSINENKKLCSIDEFWLKKKALSNKFDVLFIVFYFSLPLKKSGKMSFFRKRSDFFEKRICLWFSLKKIRISKKLYSLFETEDLLTKK